ncbi:hypothetical protein M2137_003088 [Parabacteroides sp. PFB2-10]|uniref:hypothetical protein n=1 Tax=Parabacteroides sp. PFB2-10 TaxID=1742405 RepID=UPI002475B80A|nr:hypothetical protein [Parabacteroides sp. PFB2-10]MDH6314285.1 hypothetical protein [Parabacteroides sp. PFB2-10]
MKQTKVKKGFNIQLMTAVLLTMSGIALLFFGFWTDPEGEIDHSVLVAFGETMTFAGALFGVDYSYRVKCRMKNEK